MTKTPIALISALLLPALLLPALLMPTHAGAQAAPRPDPLDAQAATLPPVHRSALAGYRRWSAETPPLPWRAANDAVERIGGWRAYAREANAPAAPASAPGSAPGSNPKR